MCGRYSLFVSPADLAERFEVTVGGYEPTYNAAPSQPLPVIADDRSDTVTHMEWGFIPRNASERTDYINARGETLASRPSFADAFTGGSGGSAVGRERPPAHQNEPGTGSNADQSSSRDDQSRTIETLACGRCLVPADGFYEWTSSQGASLPHRITRADGDLFAMAGLWSQWRPPTTQTDLDAYLDDATGAGEQSPIIETYAIVTTDANETVSSIHDRMPVILPPEEERRWLSTASDEASDLLRPFDGSLTIERVSRAVNDPTNDSPAILEGTAE